MQNIKHPYTETEQQPAQEQNFSFINRKLWEQETEQKGYKKIWHENNMAWQSSSMCLCSDIRKFVFENVCLPSCFTK
jgi:hypothetical protein